jgi:hypothetical protein
VGGVRDCPSQVKSAGGAEHGEQQLVQAIPHVGGLPVAKPTPAGRPGAVAELLGQLLPADPGDQERQDAVQAGTVVDSPSSRLRVSALDDWQ